MYKLTNGSEVIRLSDGAIIPFAPGNNDYYDYKVWLEAGGVPEPADQ